MRKILMTLIFIVGCFYVGESQIQIKNIIETEVEPFALTIDGNFGQSINGESFQQDALVTHNNFQYLAYYDSSRHVCVARKNLNRNDWEILRLTDYHFKSNDAHNTISMGICPNDGTIHLAFDHHGHDLHYRISKKGIATTPEKTEWKPSVFGAIVSELEKGKPIKITYPRFWQTPNGELQFCYRRGGSGNGDRMLVDYNSITGKWENTRQIDSGGGLFEDDLVKSESRCSYPNGYTYGPNGILHTTWVWRESSQGSNHDLIYVYSKNGGKTWLNNSGEKIDGPPHVNSPGIIVANISQKYGLMNTHGQAVDSEGNIHVVMWHCSDESLKEAGSKPGEFRWGPEEARRYFHYWRTKTGNWNKTQIPLIAGTRPKIFIDKNDRVFLVYTSQFETDKMQLGKIFEPGELVLASATKENNYKDWQIIYSQKGPFGNEILGDYYRWKKEGILSLMLQKTPDKIHQPTALKVIDLVFNED